MTKALCLALMTQVLLILAGLSLLQLISYRKKIQVAYCIPYAWGIGLLFLYGSGNIFFRLGLLVQTWHFIVFAIIFLLILSAFFINRRASRPEERVSVRLDFAWYEWLIVCLIIIKAILISHALLTNPVIDSDASNPLRWVGLAKLISESDELFDIRNCVDRFSPSLLPLWVRMFLPRWFDNLIGLPWLFTYFSFVGVSFVACYRITKHRLSAFICAYIFSSIPLATVHVFRPGYSELLVAYFFLMALTIITLAFAKEFSSGLAFWCSISVLAGIGGLLSKQEGTIWFLWILIVWFSFYLNVKRGITWRKILWIQMAALGPLYLIYFFSADFIVSHISMDDPMAWRFKWLFQKQYDPQAIIFFIQHAFTLGSFNLLWWFTAIMAIFLLFRSGSMPSKALSLYVVALFASVFYFACFTGNVQATRVGTNVGRFLLQISGILFPLYCLFVKEIIIEKPKGPLSDNFSMSSLLIAILNRMPRFNRQKKSREPNQ